MRHLKYTDIMLNDLLAWHIAKTDKNYLKARVAACFISQSGIDYLHEGADAMQEYANKLMKQFVPYTSAKPHWARANNSFNEVCPLNEQSMSLGIFGPYLQSSNAVLSKPTAPDENSVQELATSIWVPYFNAIKAQKEVAEIGTDKIRVDFPEEAEKYHYKGDMMLTSHVAIFYLNDLTAKIISITKQVIFPKGTSNASKQSSDASYFHANKIYDYNKLHRPLLATILKKKKALVIKLKLFNKGEYPPTNVKGNVDKKVILNRIYYCDQKMNLDEKQEPQSKSDVTSSKKRKRDLLMMKIL